MQSPFGDVGNLLKGGEASVIALDGYDRFRPFLQQRTRQSARTRAYLKHCRLGQWSCGAGDPAGDIEVKQEVLAK